VIAEGKNEIGNAGILLKLICM
jgi:hypothetical protein